MSKRDERRYATRSAGLFSTNPRVMQEQREQTENLVPFAWKLKKCSRCKKQRSAGQYRKDGTICKQCLPWK